MELKDIYYTQNKIPEQTLDVFLPDNAKGEIPVFIYFHGVGPESVKKEDLPPQHLLKIMWEQYRLTTVCIPITVEDNI